MNYLFYLILFMSNVSLFATEMPSKGDIQRVNRYIDTLEIEFNSLTDSKQVKKSLKNLKKALKSVKAVSSCEKSFKKP